MSRYIRSLVAGAVLSLFGCAAQALEPFGGTPAGHAEIQAFHDEAIAKFNAGDVAGSVDDYLEQLRVLHTQSTDIRGRESLRESWTKGFAIARPYLVSEIVDMGMNGNTTGSWAYMVCKYAAVTLEKDSNTPKGEISDGRYIALLTKTETGWKVLLDIDNGAAGAAPDQVARLKKELGL